MAITTIDSSIKDFFQAVNEDKAVACDSKGHWYVEGIFMRIVRWIFRLDDRRIANVALAFNNCLDKLEKIPVNFNANANAGKASEKVDFESYVLCAKVLQDKMKECRSDDAKKEFARLNVRVAGLKYRLEGINGGCDKTNVDPNLLIDIRAIAEKWKAEKFYLPVKKLTERDEQRLSEACHYPEFAQLLLKDTALKEQFFRWIIKCGNQVRPFIEFPAKQQKIRDSLLSSRIGCFGGDALRVQMANGNDGLVQKHLTLLIEGKPYSILDEQHKVTLKGNYTLSIEKILKIFAAKNKRVGSLTFFPTGVENWNVNKLAWYNADKKRYEPINLNLPKWWEQMPKCQTISYKEASQRYGFACDGTKWIGSLKSTRETMTQALGGTHGYLELAIPESSGKYRLYSFGKYAITFPNAPWEYIGAVFGTGPGLISYPDENIALLHREQTEFSVPMTEAEGLNVMQTIKEDILKAWKGNMAFQILSDNCCKWAGKTLSKNLGPEKVPPLCTIPFEEVQPGGVIGKIFEVLKKTPAPVRRGLLTTLVFPLGSWSSKKLIKKNGKEKHISLYNNPPWGEKGTLHHPAMLFYNKKQSLN